MMQNTGDKLAKLIVRYAADATTATQLRRLPAFAVADKAGEVFSNLLDRLSRAESVNAANS
jgi:hypothetical protein